MSQLRKAARRKAKIRLGLAGPAGSGKTATALLIAYGICGDWNKISLIDSESGSGDLYANHKIGETKIGEYNILPLEAPFTPEKYSAAIRECEEAGMEVVIIDSITHEWSGQGGCLDLHEQAVQRMRTPNSYTAWAEITPRHQKFIDSILQSKAHIITTVRSKTDYILTEKNGKQVPQKVGMAAVTRDGFEYELTVSLDLSLEHKALASKDRTGMFMDQPSFIPSSFTGQQIVEWCESGIDVDQEISDAVNKLKKCNSKEDLTILKEMLPNHVINSDIFKNEGTKRFNEITNKKEKVNA